MMQRCCSPQAVKDALAYVELIGTAADKDWLAAMKRGGLLGC